MRRVTASRCAAALLATAACFTIMATQFAPHDPNIRFADSPSAPPTRVHFVDSDGRLTRPYFRPWRLVDRLQATYELSGTEVSLRFFERGRFVTDSGDVSQPLLLLGADGSGRDVFSRLVVGARASLGIAVVATVASVLMGIFFGGLAGGYGGWLDAVIIRLCDVVAVLPAVYLMVTLRAALPLVVPAAVTVAILIMLLSVVGAPWIARGVRPIVAAERQCAYAEAARAMGASRWSILWRHLIPASVGFVSRQAALLVPAFVLAEATLSFVGLGLPDTLPSWGTSLREASNLTLISTAPWVLAPAGAVFLLTLLVNIATGDVGLSRTLTAGTSSVAAR